MEGTFETPVGITQIHPEERLEPRSSCWPPFPLLLLTCQVLRASTPGLPPASPWLRVPSSKTVSPVIFFHKD